MLVSQPPQPDEVKPYIIYPPFPQPPPGTVIIPFSQFQPLGIAVRTDVEEDDAEMDGLGIRTTRLRVRHDLTAAERKNLKGRKKSRKVVAVDDNGQFRKLLWHEEWAQVEELDRFSCDPQLTDYDRLWDAHMTFKEKRSWPPTTSPVSNLWEQMRLYMGLVSSIQPPPSKRNRDPITAPIDTAVDDDDDFEDIVTDKDLAVNMTDNISGRDEQLGSNDPDAYKEIQNELRDEKDEHKKEFFLYDTENALKVFFSSHYRNKGFIWDKRRSEDGPILFGFFLRFLIRNNVFPEPEISRGLQRALTVCELARVELPATFVVSKALEDPVSKSFQELYTRMSDGFLGWPSDESNEGDNAAVADAGEPDAKKRKIDTDEAPGWSAADDAALIDANNIQVDEQALKDAIEDNVDLNGVEVRATGGDNWASDVDGPGGEPGGGWGDWNLAGSAWGNEQPAWDSGSAWGGGAVNWDDPIDDHNASTTHHTDVQWEDKTSGGDPWGIPATSALLSVLGPTVLPFTHTTGIVEWSTRRVIKIVSPSPPKPMSKSEKKKGGDAALVEEELQRRLGYMVVAPWVKTGGQAASNVTYPVIQRHSRGHVVPTFAGTETAGAQPPEDAFDPLSDEIQVLLAPETLSKVSLNMGLSATWVQLARKDPPGDTPQEEEDKSTKIKRKDMRKGGPGKNGEPTKWWYMEQLMAALPSFHMDHVEPGHVTEVVEAG